MAFKFISSACRLAVGGLRLPSGLLRGRNSNRWTLVSVDVFETLLVRSTDDEAVWREGASRTVEAARKSGLVVHTEPHALRLAVERRLSREAIASGRDPEFSHRQVLEEMLRELGAGEWRFNLAADLANWEMEREGATTGPVTNTAAWVRNWANSGMRVVAVSDTRYTAQELATLLARHGISGLATIYTSADHGASKFSGKLFDLVAKLESADPQKILHIGDSMTTDWLAAAQRGLAIRPVQILSRPRS